MINKRFLYYKKLDTFRNDLNEGIIDRESIGFIEDANLIWTHDKFFNCGGTDISAVTKINLDGTVYTPVAGVLTMPSYPVVLIVNESDILSIVNKYDNN